MPIVLKRELALNLVSSIKRFTDAKDGLTFAAKSMGMEAGQPGVSLTADGIRYDIQLRGDGVVAWSATQDLGALGALVDPQPHDTVPVAAVAAAIEAVHTAVAEAVADKPKRGRPAKAKTPETDAPAPAAPAAQDSLDDLFNTPVAPPAPAAPAAEKPKADKPMSTEDFRDYVRKAAGALGGGSIPRVKAEALGGRIPQDVPPAEYAAVCAKLQAMVDAHKAGKA